MNDFVDYHNGDNLGLEPTTPRQVRRECLTLVFEKPISPAVHAIFAAQEWVAASHYDALQERDNYAREVAELRAENKRLREELSKMRAEPSDEEIDSIAASMPDGAGGMLKQWGYRQFARALLARYGQPAAQTKRRPYNASASLSEYGIFPECDAAQAPAANADAWKAAVDHELTAFHSTADSFVNPREAVRALIDWHISVERDRVADLEAELEERIAEQKTAKEYARAAVLADREAQQQDKLDAARYRLLRKGVVDDVAVVRGLGSMDYGMSAVVYTFSEELDGDDLDAAIDAAMRKEMSND